MNMPRQILAWFTAFGFLAVGHGMADTTVGGFITADTHWTVGDSPYVAAESILVMDGATLTIDPGVEVRFAPATGLVVTEGQLLARGTVGEPIRFTANAPNPSLPESRWGQLALFDGAVDATFDTMGNYLAGSIVEHAILEHAGSLGDPGSSPEAVVRIDRSVPYVHSNVIQDNAASGIYATSSDGLRIENNIIARNSVGMKGGGIRIQGSDNVIVSGNDVLDNSTTNNCCGGNGGGGIHLESSHAGLVSDNLISGNSTPKYGSAVYLLYSNDGTLLNNTIVGNLDGMGVIFVDHSSRTDLVGNEIASNNVDHLYGAVTIFWSDTAELEDNIITGNFGKGVYVARSEGMTVSGDRILDNLGPGLHASSETPGLALSSDPANPTWIYGNTAEQVYNNQEFTGSTDPLGLGNIDGRNVYWGTMDEETIRGGIYDFFDDCTRGIVFFDPWTGPEAGDANLDACVDGLDYVIWSNNYLTGTTWEQGDFTHDQVADGLDYVVWSNNFLQGCPGRVPGPAALALLALGGLALLRRRSALVIRSRR